MADGLATLQAMTKNLFHGMLGIRITSAEPDRVTAELDVRDELCTVPGTMHGGALMAFADTLGAAGTLLNLPPGHTTSTIESKTNFYAPGIPGTTVKADCVALHRGKRTMSWQTRITGPNGNLLAQVTQTQMVLEPKRTPQQTMGALFDGLDAGRQKALLAELERGGAAIYRRLAEQEPDPEAKQALLDAAAREEANADMLEAAGRS